MSLKFNKLKDLWPFKVNKSKSAIGLNGGIKGVLNTKTNNNNSNIPFYKKKWFMWIMMFCIPPIGIILMWLYSDYKKVPKIALSIFFGLVSISAYSNIENNSLQSTTVLEAENSNSLADENNIENINLTGFHEIDNILYYYGEDGNIKTGWINDNDVYYYCNELGQVQTGWIEDNNKHYYLNENGIMQTGWITYNNSYYYLDDNGVMQTGWIKDNNKHYYLNENGIMQTGWVQSDNNWYYLNSDGSMAINTKIDGYKIDSSGIATKEVIKNTSTASNSQSNKTQSSSQSSSGTNKNNNSISSSSSGGTTTYDPASNGKTVYWTPNGKSYHYNKGCSTLSRSKTILSGLGSQCPKTDPCDKCAY